MLRFIIAAMTLFALSLPAEARRYHHKRHAVLVAAHGDYRPRAWCGWWMRHRLGVADTAGNVARWWARYGRNAGGPAAGTIVVWNHHVGIITGGSPGAWIVKSGNDGNAVRERVLPLGRAIAFRWPS